MKAKLFLIILLISTIKTFSQDYINMVNDSIYWDVHISYMGYICDGYGGGGERFFFGNDTIINDTVFTNVKAYEIISDYYPEVDCPPFHVDTVYYNTTYFIHEDNSGKIFRFNSNSYYQSIDLLFDYNLKIGDSIYYEYKGYFYIDTIYNITTSDGIIRKIYIDDFTSYTGGYFIEGLGGVAGPIYEPFYLFEDGAWLKCWDYFGCDFNNCYDFQSGISDFGINNIGLTLYPNPVKSNLRISAESYIQSIVIMDINGRIIKSYFYDDTYDIEINLIDLFPGIYIFKIKTESISIIKKLIKI